MRASDLQPPAADQPGIERRAAGGDGDARDGGQVERQLGQHHAAGGGIDHALQRLADHQRMLAQLLLHVVPVAVLADRVAGQRAGGDLDRHLAARGVEHLRAAAREHRPVAVAQVGDAPGQRRQGQAVGAQEHLVVAEADRQRRAVAGADHQLGVAGEDHRQRVGALQAGQAGPRGLAGRHAALEVEVDQLRDGLGVGLGVEALPGGLELGAQLGVVLDDAVMHHRHPLGAVRVRVALGGGAVRRPAGVADAGEAVERPALQHPAEVVELALGAAAVDVAVHQGGDAGGVVAAIFEPAQRLEQQRRRVAGADDADDAAHQTVSRMAARFRRARRLAPRPGLVSWRARPNASASAGTASVTTLPAATKAPSPSSTGATSVALEPTNTPSPMTGAVLGGAVVVAGDGAGADVAAGADAGIAEIGQVVGLGAGAEVGRLQLDEVADMGGLADHGAGTQPGVGADQRALADDGTLQVAEGPDLGAGADRDARPEHHVGMHGDVGSEQGVGGQEHRLRGDQGGAVRHRRLAQAVLDLGLGSGQLGAGVDAAQLGLRRLDGADDGTLGGGQRHDVGQVVLAGGVVVVDPLQPAGQAAGLGAQRAGVAQADRALGRRRVRILDDALNGLAPLPVRRGHQAAVAGGIGRTHRQQGEVGIAPAAGLEQAPQRRLGDQRVVGVEHRDVAAAEHAPPPGAPRARCRAAAPGPPPARGRPPPPSPACRDRPPRRSGRTPRRSCRAGGAASDGRRAGAAPWAGPTSCGCRGRRRARWRWHRRVGTSSLAVAVPADGCQTPGSPRRDQFPCRNTA